MAEHRLSSVSIVEEGRVPQGMRLFSGYKLFLAS